MEGSRPRALFLSHGGGPCFFMHDTEGMFKDLNHNSEPAKWYRSLAKDWTKPSAIVLISAHWEERGTVRVTSRQGHPLLFDYYGFPPYTYELQYPCPGDPVLANRIIHLLQENGIAAEPERTRGYDHGVFIPLKLMYPQADVPVVQVSLLKSLSAKEHLRIGGVLSGLHRDYGEDLLIIGSGQATHDLRAIGNARTPPPAGGRQEGVC
ncbi:unnamed protein product [Discosporangium mesarthrocarpum]